MRCVFTTPHLNIVFELFQKIQLSNGSKVICNHSVYINSGCKIASIKFYLISAGFLHLIDKRSNFLTSHIINFNGYLTCFRNSVFNRCRRIKWIRIVLMKNKILWYIKFNFNNITVFNSSIKINLFQSVIENFATFVFNIISINIFSGFG